MRDVFDNLIAEAQEEEPRADARAIEETLLVGLLSPIVAMSILEKTRPGDYQFDLHREVAELLYPMAGEGLHLDFVTIRAALVKRYGEAKVENGLADSKHAINKLYQFAGKVVAAAATNPPPDGKILAYLDIFSEQAKRRLAKHLIAKAGTALDQGVGTPEATAGQVLRIIADLDAAQRLAGTAKTEGEELDAFFNGLQAKQAPTNDFLGLDTGFSHLNRIINGLAPGLIVLGAAPSLGKTTLVKQIADQVVSTHSDAACLFVSLEQSKEDLRIKTLSRLSGIENRDIQRGRLDPAAAPWQKIVEAKDVFAGFAGRMQILEGDRLTTVDKIRLTALQLRQKTRCARLLIVVDYLQILPVEKDFGDIRQRVNFVTSQLNQLGRDLDAPVLAIASINRAGYNITKGTLEAFKESGDIEFSANVAMILVNDPEKKKGEDNYLGIMRSYRRVFLDIPKNRNGEYSRVAFNFYPEVSRFKEMGNGPIPDN